MKLYSTPATETIKYFATPPPPNPTSPPFLHVLSTVLLYSVEPKIVNTLLRWLLLLSVSWSVCLQRHTEITECSRACSSLLHAFV